MRRLALIALVAALAACSREPAAPAGPSDTTPPVPRVRADGITVSGISSGAYMAGLLHLAHARRVDGAALIAGGPHDCALGSIQRALGGCIDGDGLDVGPLVGAARDAAQAGRIDPLEALAGDRVWMFHGTADTTVARAVVDAADAFYRDIAGIEPAVVDDVPAAHGIPTVDIGRSCDTFGEPYLQACNYDAAGALLRHLLGPLAAPDAPAGDIVSVDQRGFDGAELADSGFAYVPSGCRDTACRVHIVFHGCRQGAEFVDDAVVRGAGYNGWAEANDLVVFYPQVAASRMAPMNPLGCWDWWGYTGDDYATRDGAQLAAVMALVDRMAGSP